MYVCIYIYTEREKERERENEKVGEKAREIDGLPHRCIDI
jgi:hypothetical protein